MMLDANEMQAVQTVVTSAQYRPVPFNKLVLSAEYQARKGAPDATSAKVLEMKASIKAVGGILQNLVVVDNADGTFGVCAGGTRWFAFGLNVTDGVFSVDAPVMTMVIDRDSAHLASMIENLHRQDMHPVDEYEGFQRLAEEGRSTEQIAAIFGVSKMDVQRRLRLGSAAPALRAECKAGRLSLDTLKAFGLVADMQAQMAAWEALKPHRLQSWHVREFLNAGKVQVSSTLMEYVTLPAYEAAGGRVERDLFSDDEDGGTVADPTTLTTLALEKLTADFPLQAAQDAGWKWVDYAVTYDHAEYDSYGRISDFYVPATDEEVAELNRLRDEHSAVEMALDAAGADYDDDPETPEVKALRAQWDQLGDRIEELESPKKEWLPEHKAVAGCVVTVGYGGIRNVTYGLVRRDDRDALKAVVKATPEQPGVDAPQMPTGRAVHSDALLQTLTAERTAALSAMLTKNTHVALAQLAAQLARRVLLDCYSYQSTGMAVNCDPKLDMWKNLIPNFEETRAGKLLIEQTETWKALLPTDECLFTWMLGQSLTDILEILTLCVALTTQGVMASERIDEAPALLASAVGLDMRDWWQVSGETYLSRVPKARMIDVVTEARSAEAAAPLHKLKKADAVKAAEQALSGTGWLPTVLQTDVVTKLTASPVDED